MKQKHYERPTLACVSLATTDILLTSGAADDIVEGELLNTFTGAISEMKWSDVFD